MNVEQAKVSIRYLVAILGGVAAGWFAARGYMSREDALSLLNSEAFISLMASLSVAVWGFIARSTTNMVIAAARLPEVKKIEVSDPAIRDAVPSEPGVKVVVPRKGD